MSQAAGRPNMILITTDQQRYDSVSCNGSTFISTPNLDRIGREGVSFDRAYCPNTVCTPSRVSMMTGLYLSRHGAYNIGTSAVNDPPFLSRLLRDAGYRTRHIGKAHWYPWGTDSPETREPDEAGTPFSDFAGFEQAELCLGHAGYGVRGHYARWVAAKGYDPKTFTVEHLFEGDPNGTGEWNIPLDAHSGAWVADRAVSFLEEQAGQGPFFLNLGFQDPHHPHLVPSGFTNRVDADQVPPPLLDPEAERHPAEHITLFREGGINRSRFRGPFEMAGNGGNVDWAGYFNDPERSRQTRAYYYSMVQLIDEQMGIILDALDRLGLADNTMIIFTSDHGEMLGDHGLGHKGPLVYDGVARIPLLVRYPAAFGPGGHPSAPVSLVDLVPTMLDYAGAEDGIRRDGISLRPLLEKGEPLPRTGVRVEYKEEADRIRFKCWVTKEWKLAVYAGEAFGELYDLVNDPGEFVNRYDDPAYMQVKHRLLLEMLADMERSEPVSPRTSRV